MESDATTAGRDDALDRATHYSPFLRETAVAYPHLIELFRKNGAETAVAAALAAGGESAGAELRRRRLGLALAVSLGDLGGELSLERVTALLSNFADQAIARAIDVAFEELMPGEPQRGFAVIALGKLGSNELNFSSDVDLLLLFDPQTLPRRQRDEPGEAAVRIGQRVVELLQKRTADGYVARVDLRLRPSPEATPIVLSVNAAIAYYESAALGWERAAFVRARACAGDLAIADGFLEAIEPFVWRRAIDFGAFDEIRAIGQKVRDHYASRQSLGPGYDLKRGRGGIRETEFFAQARQLVHGGRDPRLRPAATLDAIAALERAGHMEPDLAREMATAYRRLRTIEHRVQMIADQQTHLLPAGGDEMTAVARLHGFTDGEELLDWLRPSVARVGEAFDELAGSGSQHLPSDPESLRSELAALGFADTEPAMRRISEWRSGRARSLRSSAALEAFEAMLPALLGAIAGSADPGNALNRLSDIVERVPSGVNLYRLLQARPGLSTLLARILAHAPALADQLARRPALIDSLLDASCFDPPPPAAAFARFLAEEMRGKPYDLAIDRARRIVNERRFALGVQLVDQRGDPLAVGQGYACVAEGALVALAGAAVAEFEAAHGSFPGAELVVLGLGRLGGGVLTHASDLDLIYLFTTPAADSSNGARPLGPSDYFNRLANRATAALSVSTAAGPLYDVDTRLRPQGEQGMLAVSLDAFADYQRDEAWTWEHMALARARPVFGSEAARHSVAALIRKILGQSKHSSGAAADAVTMRDEIARHKPASGPLDVKLGPGGLVDLEFAVHVLQLTHSTGLDPPLEAAVEQLASAGLIERNIVEAQKLLTRMLVVIRLLAPETATPNEDSRKLMAQLCGATGWDDLIGRHAQARHDVSQLWKKVRESA